jgi:hypothetical protein
MHLQTWADIFLVFFVVLFAFTTVVLFGIIAFTLRKVEQQVEKVTNMAEPLVAKASNTLDTVQRITANAGEKVDTILTKGETLTDDLVVKVDQTSTVVQKSVVSPLIQLSSLISGLSAGFSTWSHAAKKNAHQDAPEVTVRNGTTRHTKERVSVITPVEGTERVTVTPDGR